MAVTRKVCDLFEDFLGARSFSATPEGGTGLTIKDVSAAGTPTYASVTPSSTGEVALTLEATSEAQVVGLYWNDILALDIDNIESMSFVAKVSGIDSVTTVVMGLASAYNATQDSVTNNVWFRMQGSASTSLVVTETDDGTTDNDDKATSVSLSSTYKKFTIDFSNGKSDIRFYIDGARVSQATTFDASLITGSLQPYFLIQKASGTGTPALTLDNFHIVYRVASGA